EDPNLLFRDTDLLWNGEATLTYTPSLHTGGFSFRGTIDIPSMSLSPMSREREAPLMKLQFSDATWDGRLKWLKINQPLTELELDGDSEISRLVFLPHDRPGAVFEHLTLWGVRLEPGAGLGIGLIQARHATGANRKRVTPLPDPTMEGQTSAVSSWTAKGLEMERLKVEKELTVSLATLEAKSLRMVVEETRPPVVLNKLQLEGLEQTAEGDIGIDSLIFEGLNTQRGADMPGGIKLERGALLGLNLSAPGRIELGKVSLEGLEAGLGWDQQGEWRIPVPWLWRTEQRVILDKLSITGANRVTFADYTIEPRGRLEFGSLTGRLSGWDSDLASSGGRFTLDAIAGETGRATLTGNLNPLAEATGITMASRIQGLELSALTGYGRRELGLDLIAGRLSATTEITVQKHGIAGEAVLELQGAGFLPAVTVPDRQLLAAIDLLTDENGGIRLRIPLQEIVTGGEEPNGILGPAIVRSLKDYFSPLGITAGQLSEWLSEGRIDLPPQTLASLEDHLEGRTPAYLELLADRMGHRPGMGMELCAGHFALNTDSVPIDHTGKAGPLGMIIPSENESAVSLLERWRLLLVDEYGLDRERINICGQRQGPGACRTNDCPTTEKPDLAGSPDHFRDRTTAMRLKRSKNLSQTGFPSLQTPKPGRLPATGVLPGIGIALIHRGFE
ncbi:MAG: DUF748 domain-containing protein, partial [Gammaproteobacteria bacterium]|nr:DUF748 domain-containing protein [Gammaproteobacteria bacterium]